MRAMSCFALPHPMLFVIYRTCQSQLKELSGELAPEPLLTANDQRFVLFPIKHHDVRQRVAAMMSIKLIPARS